MKLFYTYVIFGAA